MTLSDICWKLHIRNHRADPNTCSVTCHVRTTQQIVPKEDWFAATVPDHLLAKFHQGFRSQMGHHHRHLYADDSNSLRFKKTHYKQQLVSGIVKLFNILGWCLPVIIIPKVHVPVIQLPVIIIPKVHAKLMGRACRLRWYSFPATSNAQFPTMVSPGKAQTRWSNLGPTGQQQSTPWYTTQVQS